MKDDLISRQAAIEYFMTNTNWHDEEGYEIHDAEDKRALLKSYFDGIPSAQPEQRWIPVSERLPEEERDVLITKEPFKIKGCEHEVIRAKRSVDLRSGKIEWWSPEFGALTNKAVLAWMPLPKPYKEERV